MYSVCSCDNLCKSVGILQKIWQYYSYDKSNQEYTQAVARLRLLLRSLLTLFVGDNADFVFRVCLSCRAISMAHLHALCVCFGGGGRLLTYALNSRHIACMGIVCATCIEINSALCVDAVVYLNDFVQCVVFGYVYGVKVVTIDGGVSVGCQSTLLVCGVLSTPTTTYETTQNEQYAYCYK